MSVHKLPVRLKDIAEKSGFSIGTVQRALSNTGGYSPESQKKILQIAQEMGYTANPAASALRRSTITIAVVLPKPDGDNTFFFEYIWQGIHVAQADFAVHNLNIEEHYTQSKAETVALLQKMLEASSRPQALITRAVNSPVFYELIVKVLVTGM